MFDAKYYPAKLQNMINFYILEFCGLNSIVERSRSIRRRRRSNVQRRKCNVQDRRWKVKRVEGRK